MGIHVDKLTFEEIEKYGRDACFDMFSESVDLIGDYIELNKRKVINEIIKALEDVLVQAKTCQNLNQKGKIQYINIFYMHYYYYTKKDPILIYAYDDRFYLDKTECYAGVDFSYIFDQYEKDKEKIKKIMQKKYGRVSDDLLNQFFKKYLLDYYDMVSAIVKTFCTEIEQYIDNFDCLKSQNVVIEFGSYMDECILINSKQIEV